jgi:dipeptidyl aminopeptidase/acylaminoacyl peptidase
MPQMLYGDELMFRSTDRSKGHPTLRVDFPGGWAGDEVNLFNRDEQSGDAKALFDYTRHLMNWRKTKEVIHNGKTMHFITRDNTYGYFRYNDTDVVFVYVNNSPEAKNVPWTYYSEISDGLKGGVNVVTGEPCDVSDATVVPSQSILIVEYKR